LKKLNLKSEEAADSTTQYQKLSGTGQIDLSQFNKPKRKKKNQNYTKINQVLQVLQQLMPIK
jgi:hypothetical protein